MKKQHSATGGGEAGEPGEPADGGEPGGTTSGLRPSARAQTVTAYDEYGDLVWQILHVTYVEDREAIHQDVFLDYFSYLLDNDPPKNTKAFLRTLTVHRMVKAKRRRTREPFAEDAGVDDEAGPDSQQNPERLLDDVRIARKLDEICNRLPEKKATLIRRIDLGDEDPGAIAKMLRVPEPTIRSRLNRARKAFNVAMKRLLERPPRG